MNLGTRIRECRKAAGWSQAKLAEESGISQQMLSKLERGVAFGTTEIVPLARALRVSPQWLETGDEPMVDAITPDERELLEEYRHLDPAKRPVARMTIRAMLPEQYITRYSRADFWRTHVATGRNKQQNQRADREPAKTVEHGD